MGTLTTSTGPCSIAKCQTLPEGISINIPVLSHYHILYYAIIPIYIYIYLCIQLTIVNHVQQPTVKHDQVGLYYTDRFTGLPLGLEVPPLIHQLLQHRPWESIHAHPDANWHSETGSKTGWWNHLFNLTGKPWKAHISWGNWWCPGVFSLKPM